MFLHPVEVLSQVLGLGPAWYLIPLFIEMVFFVEMLFVSVTLTGLIVILAILFPSSVVTGGVIPVVSLILSIIILVFFISIIPVVSVSSIIVPNILCRPVTLLSQLAFFFLLSVASWFNFPDRWHLPIQQVILAPFHCVASRMAKQALRTHGAF